ncbi:hypothetical protein MD588_09330 [Photobacterium sp. SDRW27]|uniref:hypothetical protein n=1 Tax=Photobacterium obscurum TaxID=2829490 RepID=UPI002244592E|nr:hypothetical protein [Photobacterium obscurum]MCW8329008.1 hypothetical protein [Photobacterium obscurum]
MTQVFFDKISMKTRKLWPPSHFRATINQSDLIIVPGLIVISETMIKEKYDVNLSAGSCGDQPEHTEK